MKSERRKPKKSPTTGSNVTKWGNYTRLTIRNRETRVANGGKGTQRRKEGAGGRFIARLTARNASATREVTKGGEYETAGCEKGAKLNYSL